VKLLFAALVSASLFPLAGHAQSPSFDGAYRGEPTSGSNCNSLFHPTLRVEGGVAKMRFNPSVTFEGKIQSNGSLDAPYGQARLAGQFADNKFTGSVSSGRCQYSLALSK
jgi:hypothetical protein